MPKIKQTKLGSNRQGLGQIGFQDSMVYIVKAKIESLLEQAEDMTMDELDNLNSKLDNL